MLERTHVTQTRHDSKCSKLAATACELQVLSLKQSMHAYERKVQESAGKAETEGNRLKRAQSSLLQHLGADTATPFNLC